MSSCCHIHRYTDLESKLCTKVFGDFFLCRFSGVTEKMLSTITTRLEEVQRRIQQILPPDAILCGQSLNADLMALKVCVG